MHIYLSTHVFVCVCVFGVHHMHTTHCTCAEFNVGRRGLFGHRSLNHHHHRRRLLVLCWSLRRPRYKRAWQLSVQQAMPDNYNITNLVIFLRRGATLICESASLSLIEGGRDLPRVVTALGPLKINGKNAFNKRSL